MSAQERIVILGGGIGGMTAAYELSDPKHEGRYDVTLYQMGWKLGGKGASGRNQEKSDRIEEHGLHVWFRSYLNAIEMMEKVYAEYAELPAGKRSIFKSFDDAFQGQSLYVFQEQYEGTWRSLPVTMPEWPSSNSPWEELIKLVEALLGLTEQVPQIKAATHPSEAGHLHVRRSLQHALDRIAQLPGHAIELTGHGPHGVLEKLLAHMKQLGPPSEHSSAQHRLMIDMLKLADNLAWMAVWPFIDSHFKIRMAWRAFHLGVSCCTGILQDGILQHGYDVIDEQEYMAWARSHSPLWSVWGSRKDEADGLAFESSPFVKAFYGTAFSYKDGDPKQPSIAAGIGMRSCLRLLLEGSGPLSQEMRAGMGDTIFSPLYEILKSRGVKIEMFQRVERLVPSSDGNLVEAVHLSQQVRLKGDSYDPLFWVKDVQCWPSEPFYDQIDEDQDKLRGHDLGHYASGWDDTGPKQKLSAGVDFDKVVLGISVPCLSIVCQELIELRDDWQLMVEGIESVRTLATQLWFRPNREKLGITGGAALTGAYVQPLSSIADFSHLIYRESWPTDSTPGYLAYACGCMPEGPISPPQAHALAQRTAYDLLADSARPLWPGAVDAKGEFDWNLLQGDPSGEAESRFANQYFRANIDVTELYVQSAPGSSKYRLKPGASGFDNLVLTGTWIDTGINVSCVETAVVSGKQAARVITADPTPILREGDFS